MQRFSNIPHAYRSGMSMVSELKPSPDYKKNRSIDESLKARSFYSPSDLSFISVVKRAILTNPKKSEKYDVS